MDNWNAQKFDSLLVEKTTGLLIYTAETSYSVQTIQGVEKCNGYSAV